MDLFLLDTKLDVVAVIDTYESLIWVERYDSYGDFELVMPVTEDVLKLLKQDYYIENQESEHLMIIEKILVTSDPEDGNRLTISGRSVESILDRRVVWGMQTVSGKFQNGIKTLLQSNIISPSNADRKIGNFIFEASSDPAITGLTLNAQFTGDNVYDVIHELCADRNLGFKVTLNDAKKFVFKLYAGKDRSYNQLTNPYVVFSPKFDNMINSNYIESRLLLKNIALIGGEGEGSERKYATTNSTASGLDRRELFVDARDISSDTGSETPMSDDEYTALLLQRGSENLAENIEVVSFEGEVDVTTAFKYREDFYNGDIVQIANEYGHETASRVVEVIISENKNGRTVYPTFKST